MFDSHNLFSNLTVISARSPQELAERIGKITTPIKIIQITTSNNRHHCYFLADIKVQVEKKLNKPVKVNELQGSK